MKNVAIVGFGFMGKTHAQQIIRHPGLRLVAVVDKNPAILNTLTDASGNFSTEGFSSEDLKQVQSYTDLDHCLEQEKVDLVHICVHTSLHYAMAKLAIEKGKHVLVEKPMTLDLLEAQELISLAGEKGVMLMVAHVVRFMDAYRRLKHWVDSGEWGALKYLSLTRFSGTPSWGDWKNRTSFGSTGGALFDLVIHDIDFANYLLGAPAKIDAQVRPGVLSNHDYLNAFWQYKSGIEIKIEGGNRYHPSFPFQAGFMANFEDASVSFSNLNPGYIELASSEGLQKIEVKDMGEGFYNEINYFQSCIDNGHSPGECMPESSLETLRLCYRHID